MTQKRRLDDQSSFEPIEDEIDGRIYRGQLCIKRIDAKMSAFEVSYGGQYHQDTSLFPHGAVDQMRAHARFVLRRMVQDDVAKGGP